MITETILTLLVLTYGMVTIVLIAKKKQQATVLLHIITFLGGLFYYVYGAMQIFEGDIFFWEATVLMIVNIWAVFIHAWSYKYGINSW